MEKYQPEGQHDRITASSKLYSNQIMKMGVFAVIAKEFTIKVKFGQNMPPDKLDKIIEEPQTRGEKRDLLTIDAINKYREKPLLSKTIS